MKYTEENLEELALAEAEAKSAYLSAKDAANLARSCLANQALDRAGVVIGKTICSTNKWGFSSLLQRVIVKGVFDDGRVECAPVTAKGKVHAGMDSFLTSVDKVKPEAAA